MKETGRDRSYIEVAPISVDIAGQATKESEVMLTNAEVVKITNQPQYDSAGELLKAVKGKMKWLESERKKITTPLDTAKKAVQALFGKPKETLQQAESILKQGRLTYEQEQEVIRLALEEKLRKQAEVEENRKRKALEEQAQRQEEKAAELRRQAEEANAKERAILEEKARLADEKAEARREKKEEVYVPAPVVASTVQKTKGICTKDNWECKVEDEKVVPREWLIVNEKALTAFAKSTKGTVKIPGVRFYNKSIVSSGS